MNFMLDSNATLELWSERLIAASWQGGILLGMAWLLCRYVKPLSATAKCWIWRIAYLKFAVVLLLGGLFEIPVFQPTDSTTDTTIAAISADGSETDSTISTQNDVNAKNDPSLALANEQAESSVGVSPNPASTSRVSSADLALSLLFGMWLLGALFGILVIAKQFSFAYRIVRHSRRVTEKPIVTSYRLLCSQLRLSTPPRLATTTLVSSPMLVGALYPTILLPTKLVNSLPLEELRLIIAHELGHAKRRDLLWNWLLVFVRAVFFFHPLIWLTQKRFALDQELACDQLALETTNGNFQQYGNLLVKCSASTSRGAARSLAAVGAVSSFKTLRERILEMNRMNQKPSQLAGVLSAVVIVGSLALVTPVKLVAQQRVSDEARASSSSQESSSTTASGRNAISSSSSNTQATNERKDVSVTVSNDGVRESIKVKWKNNGEVSVTYSSDAAEKKTPQKYNLTNIQELEQQNPAAYRFYKKHVTSTPGSVSATVGSGRNATAGSARNATGTNFGIGRVSDSQGARNRYERYPSENRPSQRAISGSGGSASSSSSSSSSAMGRNGTGMSRQSTSSSSSSNSGNTDDVIQQIRNMMEKTDDSEMQRVLQQMIEQIENNRNNQNRNNAAGRGENRRRR